MRSSAKPHLPESSAEGSLAANGSAAPLPRAEEQSEGKQAGREQRPQGHSLVHLHSLCIKATVALPWGRGAHR